MNLVFKLYRLQQVDSHLDQLTGRLKAIDAILADDSALQKLQAQAAFSADIMKEAQRALRTAEHNTHTQREKIKQTETRLYSGKVTNPKELQDLQNEAAALKRYLAVLEDRQLEAMLALDEAETQAQGDQDELDTLEASTQARAKELRTEHAALTGEVSRLKEERLAASSGIPADTLSHYEALRGKRQGVAVAQVADKACSACGSTLSSTLLQEARSPGEITHCSFCGRILYGN